MIGRSIARTQVLSDGLSALICSEPDMEVTGTVGPDTANSNTAPYLPRVDTFPQRSACHDGTNAGHDLETAKCFPNVSLHHFCRCRRSTQTPVKEFRPNVACAWVRCLRYLSGPSRNGAPTHGALRRPGQRHVLTVATEAVGVFVPARTHAVLREL